MLVVTQRLCLLSTCIQSCRLISKVIRSVRICDGSRLLLCCHSDCAVAIVLSKLSTRNCANCASTALFRSVHRCPSFHLPSSFRPPPQGDTSLLLTFFGGRAKLRKATVSFIMSVCPYGRARHPPD